MYAAGIGIPLLVALAFTDAQTALFASIGALLALQSDPRRSLRLHIIAICLALTIILLAATLGVALQGDRVPVDLAVLTIAFVAGIPKPVFPYLTFVGKVAAAVVIITSAGMAPPLSAAVAFVAGGASGLVATLLAMHWRDKRDLGVSPIDEIRAVWSGQTNTLFYAVSLVVAVALGLGFAEFLHAFLPGWVGLTVLLVMHPDDATALRLGARRIGGTLAGVAVAGVIVHFLHVPWALAVVAIVCAAAFPWASVTGYFTVSFVITTMMMLLLDLAQPAPGGDTMFLLWRLYDTLLGCLAAAITLAAVHLYRRWRAVRGQ
jgi:Fusaric acid resistance protein-like